MEDGCNQEQIVSLPSRKVYSLAEKRLLRGARGCVDDVGKDMRSHLPKYSIHTYNNEKSIFILTF